MQRILLAEDDEIMRITLQDTMEGQGWHVDAAVNGLEALEMLNCNNYHLLLSDIRMPGMDGKELLKKCLEMSPLTGVIMMTAYGSVQAAVECLKEGAADYMLKPFDSDDLIIRINRIFEMQEVKARCASLEECCKRFHPPLLGNSGLIKRVIEMINQVGPAESTVLISGESGTGKELAAAGIHRASHRADKPYIRLNCAAIPEGLLESELFGHERGAFTGAHSKKPGRFELADGGTLLLDEIGDLPLAMQAKLLRVLQENECERVGGTRTIKLDVRVLCSTALDLRDEVKEGRFRQDLLYRLRVIPLTMPSLRDRKEDIPLLANHFLREFSINRKSLLTLSSEAMELLLNYDFPGNVRELKNMMERVSVLAPDSVITAADLPQNLHSQQTEPSYSAGDTPLPLAQAVSITEKQCVLNALNRTEGNRTRAAELLGISRKNLWQKMKLHNIVM